MCETQRVYLIKAKLFMITNKSVTVCIFIFVCHSVWASKGNLAQINSVTCACPGEVLTIECAIIGGGSTLWEGTAFQCESIHNNFIALRHSQFSASEKPQESCNNGAIVASAIRVVNNTYISQLNVTVSLEMNNTTVECVHDYNLTSTIVKSILVIVSATGRLMRLMCALSV